MLLLPRKPLEVNASIFCSKPPNAHMFSGEPEDAIYDGIRRLLEASVTRRPYTGLIIREALRGKELQDFQAGGKRAEAARKVTAFLRPVNAALHDWWPTQPQARNYEPSELEDNGEIRSGGIGWHLDQEIEDSAPVMGPISTSTTISGTSTYFFKIMRKNVWDPEDADYINKQKRRDTAPLPQHGYGIHQIVANPGDLVAWADIPPMWHGVEGTPDRTAVLRGATIHEFLG